MQPVRLGLQHHCFARLTKGAQSVPWRTACMNVHIYMYIYTYALHVIMLLQFETSSKCLMARDFKALITPLEPQQASSHTKRVGRFRAAVALQLYNL